MAVVVMRSVYLCVASQAELVRLRRHAKSFDDNIEQLGSLARQGNQVLRDNAIEVCHPFLLGGQPSGCAC